MTQNFKMGAWDQTYMNINIHTTPIISIYICASKGNKSYSLYKWDNMHIPYIEIDSKNKLMITGVDEI